MERTPAAPTPKESESNLKVSTACNLITAASLSFLVSSSCVVLTPIVNKMISYGASYGVGKAKEVAAVGKYILSTAKPFAAIILLSPSLLTVSGVLLNATYS